MKKLLSFILASMLVCFTALGIPYIFNFGGNGTNTSNYGVFLNLGTNNGAAILYVYDADGTTILGGFDTNRGGWFGLGLSNQVTMDITNVTIYNTLTIQSNVVVTLVTNVTFNVKGGSKVVFQVPSSLVNSNATPSTIASWDALNTLTNTPNGTGFLHDDGAGGFTWSTPSYDTNAVPNTGVLTFGHSYWTNLQTDITLPALTLGSASFYESLVLMITNSTAADHTVTVPSGVRVAIANGGGTKLYCTNKTVTAIYIEHYGNIHTNAWKNDY